MYCSEELQFISGKLIVVILLLLGFWTLWIQHYSLRCRVRMHTLKACRLHRPIAFQCLRITPTRHRYFWRRKEIRFPERFYCWNRRHRKKYEEVSKPKLKCVSSSERFIADWHFYCQITWIKTIIECPYLLTYLLHGAESFLRS